MNYKHGMRHSQLYTSWLAMRRRCNTPINNMYQYYGAKGIKVCPEWDNSSTAFIAWALNNGYKPGLTIDRIDNKIGYCPENCQWISNIDNIRKRSSTKLNIEKVEEIKMKYGTNIYTCKSLGKDYNVTATQICAIINNRTWRNK